MQKEEKVPEGPNSLDNNIEQNKNQINNDDKEQTTKIKRIKMKSFKFLKMIYRFFCRFFSKLFSRKGEVEMLSEEIRIKKAKEELLFEVSKWGAIQGKKMKFDIMELSIEFYDKMEELEKKILATEHDKIRELKIAMWHRRLDEFSGIINTLMDDYDENFEVHGKAIDLEELRKVTNNYYKKASEISLDMIGKDNPQLDQIKAFLELAERTRK